MNPLIQFNTDSEAPVLAIHGSAASGRQWRPLRDALRDGRKLLAPDLAGYGDRPGAEHSERPGLRSRARPLIKALQQLGRPVHIVAHSFGAAVALELLRCVPDAARSLWLYEPVVPGLLQLDDAPGDESLGSDLACLAEVLDRASARVGMAAFIDFWHGGDCWTTIPEATRRRLAEQARTVLRDFREACAQPASVYQSLNFAGPVQIAVGEHARPHAVRMADILGRLLPRSRRHCFEGMGHMGPTTHPGPVNEVIVSWITRQEQHGSVSTSPEIRAAAATT